MKKKQPGFAPDHYRSDWQQASRGSGLPFGYFGRRTIPWNDVLNSILKWTVLILLALFFLWM